MENRIGYAADTDESSDVEWPGCLPIFATTNDTSAMEDWGDYVAWSDDEEGEVTCNAENIDKYDEGLYAQIRLGDVLDGNYQIIHKLGHGNFSTVWMAYDRHAKRDVALKIMIPGHVAENDYNMQTRIKTEVHDHTGLILYNHSFFIDGDFGQKHRVLVLPMVGPNLDTIVKERPMPARQIAARQLLESLARLHAAGFVMNGMSAPIFVEMDTYLSSV